MPNLRTPRLCLQVHRSLLTKTLLPLHEPNQMAVWDRQQPVLECYHEALVGCLVPLVERQPDLLLVIFESLVLAWPEGFSSNTAKVWWKGDGWRFRGSTRLFLFSYRETIPDACSLARCH